MMNGIENITERILEDARAEAKTILDEANAKAAEIAAEAAANAQAQAQAICRKGQEEAEQRRQRLGSVAQLEARKMLLDAKQQMLGRAFSQALEQLCGLSDEKAVELLSRLAVAASATGKEQVILSEKDRERIGSQVVRRANQLLAGEVAPELPEELSKSPVGNILNRVVAGASAMLAGTAMLSLADESRPMAGGLILRDGPVETNCTFETLVELHRSELAAPVAKLLFG